MLKRLRYALEFFAPLFPGRRMLNYHLATTHLQDLLGQMNDHVAATQFTDEALPGGKGRFVDDWLAARNERMGQKLGKSLTGFLKLEAPWKH